MGNDSGPLSLSDVLAEHGDFVRALARRLVGRDEADDVAQETFVRLVEHPPGSAGNLRAWLATVTRNLVRARGQAKGRRRAREEDSARAEHLPSAAQELEQAELVKLVVTAAMELDEPYRATILSRYLRGWSAEQTARADGVPVTTVRSREQRALEQLRRKLDRHFDARQAWVGLLLATLEPATVHVPVTPPRAPVLAWSCALVFLVSAGAWFVAGGSARRSTTARVEPVAVPAQARPARAPGVTPPSEPRAALPDSPAPAPVVAELGEIRGRLRVPGGEPAVGVRVTLHGWPASRERELLYGLPEWSDLETESDAEGVFSFHFDPPGAFQFALAVEDERFAVLGWRIDGLARGARRDLEPATLEPAGTIEGTLVDTQGRPVAARGVLLTLERSDEPEFGTLSERSDELRYTSVAPDGRFRFTRVPSGEHVLILEHRSSKHRGPRVRLAPGESVRVDLPCPPLEAPRVLEVYLTWQDLPLALLEAPAADLRLFGPSGELHTADARGRFTDLGPGPYRLEFEHPWFEPVSLADLEPGRARTIHLRGKSRARLAFVVPEGSASVPERVLVRYPKSGRSPDAFVAHAGETPLADGIVGGLIPGDAELVVRLPGLGERCVALPGLTAGETRTVTLDFTRATALVGRVQHADGAPLAGLEVALLVPARKDDSPASRVVGSPPSDSSHDPWRRVQARVLTDEDGRYRFDLAAGGRFALQVEPPNGAIIASEAFELAQDTLVTRDVHVPCAVELSGRVTGALDVPLERLRLWACPADPAQAERHDPGLESAVALEPDGRFRLELAAGDWRLLIVLPAEELASSTRSAGYVGGTRELGRVTLVEGQPATLELALGAHAPVRHTFELHTNGAPAAGVRLTLRDERGFDVQGVTGGDGRAHLWLFPGDHEVWAGTREWSTRLGAHGVLPARPEQRRFELELVRARLRFLADDGTALARQAVGLLLPGPRGDDWSLFRGRTTDDEGALEFTLVPGRYGFTRDLNGPDRRVVPLDWTASGPAVPELRL